MAYNETPLRKVKPVNDMDAQIVEAVSDAVDTVPVRTIAVSVLAGAAATAVTIVGTKLVRRYLEVKKARKALEAESEHDAN